MSSKKFVICKIISDDKFFNNTAVIVSLTYCKIVNGQTYVAYDSPPFNEQDIILINNLVKTVAPFPQVWNFFLCQQLSVRGK